MRDLNLQNAGCEPSRGLRAALTLPRRALRRVLRPFIARLIEILNDLADRLDVADGRLDAADVRFERTEAAVAAAALRFDDEAERLEKVRLRTELAFDKIRHGESRHDQAESRLDQAERHIEILLHKSHGTSVHLEGLSGDHLDLNARFESRVVQLSAIARSVEGLDHRQDELDEKLQAVHALHWDHIALARRLAVLEDLLAASSGPMESERSIPFPGFEKDARSRVG